MANKSTDHIGSFAKGLRVLEAFGAEHQRLTISEAAELTGLDRATARRCLLTLHHEGFASYDGKYFALTHAALRLGSSVLASLSLPQVVQPWLDQLTETIGQSCSVAVLDQAEIVYVARAAQRRVMSIGLMPGSRLPAFCTSMGRVLMAELPEAEAREILARSDLTPRTSFSLTDPERIMAELAQVRSAGFASVDQEIEIGLRSLAVPLRTAKGEVVAALNIGMAAIHADMATFQQEYLPHLHRLQTGLQRVL